MSQFCVIFTLTESVLYILFIVSGFLNTQTNIYILDSFFLSSKKKKIQAKISDNLILKSKLWLMYKSTVFTWVGRRNHMLFAKAAIYKLNPAFIKS